MNPIMKQKNVSLAGQVFDRLEQDILTGVYPHGSIITELELCTKLGVSRTPIREALHRLAQEHMVEESPAGILVLGITDKDALNIFEIRVRIEGLAARDAAKNITPDQLKELRDVLELQEFYATKLDTEKLRLMDNEFHNAVCRFSGSTVFFDTLTNLHRKVQKYRKESLEQVDRIHASTAEHRAIYEAIAAHDADKAEELAVEHAKKAQENFLKCQSKGARA